MKKYGKRVLVSICTFPMFIVLLMGCGDTESENIKTKGMHADIEVSTTGDESTVVKAEMSVGSGGATTRLELTGGDRLVATAGEHSQQLSQTSNVLGIYYTATLPRLEAETVINVALYREDDPNAEDTNVTMPAPLTITEPADWAAVDDTAPIVFSWNPSGTEDTMRLDTDYECQKTNDKGSVVTARGSGPQFVINDHTGSASYSLMDLLGKVHPPEDYDQGCSRITVTLRRERFGSVDPLYDGGDISATQIRSVNLQYTP